MWSFGIVQEDFGRCQLRFGDTFPIPHTGMLRTQVIHLAHSLPVTSPLRKELLKLAAKKPGKFITDFGAVTTFVLDGTDEKMELPRYGVWGNKGHWSGKAEVLEVSDDLEALQRKYGPDLPVQKLP